METLNKLIESFKKEAARHPKYPDLRNKLGLALALRKNYKEAIMQYKEALQINQKYLVCSINLAFALAAEGKPQESSELLGKVIAQSPDNHIALSAYGQYLFINNNIKEAIRYFDKARRTRPDLRCHIHNTAVSQLFLSPPNLKGAERLFRRALKGEGYGKYYKEIELFVSGMFNPTDSVKEKLKEPFSMNVNYIKTYIDMANYLAAEGKHEEADKKFALALALAPESADIENAIGEIEVRKDNLASAASHFKLAISYDRRHVMAHTNLAFIYGEKGQLRNALREMRVVVTLAPNYADLRYQLGTLLLELKKYSEAAEHFSAAISLNPNYTFAQNGLATALFHAGKYKEAIPVFMQILPVAPKPLSAEIHGNLAACFIKLGQAEDAISESKAACHEDKERAIFRLYMAQAYYLNGERGKSRNELRKYFKLRSGREGIEEARTLLAALDKKTRIKQKLQKT
ncbi:MAG: tetratricopeptide repeat protein [Planctomycetota bacterium]